MVPLVPGLKFSWIQGLMAIKADEQRSKYPYQMHKIFAVLLPCRQGSGRGCPPGPFSHPQWTKGLIPLVTFSVIMFGTLETKRA